MKTYSVDLYMEGSICAFLVEAASEEQAESQVVWIIRCILPSTISLLDLNYHYSIIEKI